MKTSVVMTIYNGSKYLLEMLDSLRNQTRNIDEVLLLDDMSTDNSQVIVRDYISKYNLKNWNLIINAQNLGWEKNFTNGINKATGDIIFPCDQDDIWHLDKIEKMTYAFENNYDILLLISDYHAFGKNDGKEAIQQQVRTETKEIVSRVVFDEKYYQICRPGCTMAFHREILPTFNALWKAGTPHDALLWGIASIQQRLYLYKEAFIEYRRHELNASKSITHEYKYKVNEVERTMLVNDWYLREFQVNAEKELVIRQCNKWCFFRKKLLVDKNILYWFKLCPLSKYYLKKRKYYGDLFYFIKGLGMK